MNKTSFLFRNGPVTLLCLGTMAVVMMCGCASTTSKEVAAHQRGWIGGEYKLVKKFPPELKHKQHAALLVTSLNSNTPAAMAGLNEGDLILAMNREKATGLKKFYACVDKSEPGTILAIKAWHDGEIIERNVRVGRETYSNQGVFMVGLPGYFHAVNLGHHAGFSLGVLGYKPDMCADRKELNSTEERYLKRCTAKNYEVSEPGWKAWLVIMQAESSKTIKSQETVTTQTASSQKPEESSSFANR
jgi:hypothetical protein